VTHANNARFCAKNDKKRDTSLKGCNMSKASKIVVNAPEIASIDEARTIIASHIKGEKQANYAKAIEFAKAHELREARLRDEAIKAQMNDENKIVEIIAPNVAISTIAPVAPVNASPVAIVNFTPVGAIATIAGANVTPHQMATRTPHKAHANVVANNMTPDERATGVRALLTRLSSCKGDTRQQKAIRRELRGKYNYYISHEGK